ncbi:MAG TPA: aminoglycoside 6-adenylyltransferase [bacterium]|jgi:predicted nucleotidyltransferase|nr:aminoglycoside 6-adenylyltransferase [bacterium]
MGRPQSELVERFAAACRADDRVVAAFLGGSLASGTADEHSDLDLYLITREDAYKPFFDGRQEFMRRLGTPVFSEDFSEFGFDMVLFIYEDGTYGELALAPESNFLHIHGGPYKTLVDKKGLLESLTFPYFAPGHEDRRHEVRRALVWFWRELLYAAKSLARGRLWSTGYYVERLRRHVKTLLDHHYNRTAPPGAAKPLETTIPGEDRAALDATYGRLEPADLARALNALVIAYRRVAPAAAGSFDLQYPDALDRVVTSIAFGNSAGKKG